MTSGDLLHENRMPKTDCDGKKMLRPSANKWIEMMMMRCTNYLSSCLRTFIWLIVRENCLPQGKDNVLK